MEGSQSPAAGLLAICPSERRLSRQLSYQLDRQTSHLERRLSQELENPREKVQLPEEDWPEAEAANAFTLSLSSIPIATDVFKTA